ncbi:hypothetical protein AVEN_149609-1 [Araneus ventricosus]|uniref:Uncharacterized protein n=1 Tax=Araneus ventricosus TaxID=182803 RepID=A0A4Y2KYL1_ARAVE|nr:hypothetical protein AVEN_149609-1 [Araneus ventricosus]
MESSPCDTTRSTLSSRPAAYGIGRLVAIVESGTENNDDVTVTPVVTNLLAVARALDRFGISDRAGAAIVSASLQYVGIMSESNVSNVVNRNKIRRERTKARTTLRLTDDRNYIRELALPRILKALKIKRSAAATTIATNNIRFFNLPPFDLCAMVYVNLIKWENVKEPPLTERFSDDMIAEAIVNPPIFQESVLPTIKRFPCHTQAT